MLHQQLKVEVKCWDNLPYGLTEISLNGSAADNGEIYLRLRISRDIITDSYEHESSQQMQSCGTNRSGGDSSLCGKDPLLLRHKRPIP